MRSFICAYNFSRKLTSSKPFKAILQEKSAQIAGVQPQTEQNSSNKDSHIEEIQKMQQDYTGTKSMKMLDNMIDYYFKKGYSVDRILSEVHKGRIITDELKNTFKEDSKKSKKMQEKCEEVQRKVSNLSEEQDNLTYSKIQGSNQEKVSSKDTTADATQKKKHKSSKENLGEAIDKKGGQKTKAKDSGKVIQANQDNKKSSEKKKNKPQAQ